MFTISYIKVIAENFYCPQCGEWVYCPEMNCKYQDKDGKPVEKIGEGCTKQDKEGEYLECPACKAKFYLIKA